MLRLCIIESYGGGLTELNETFEINLTASKSFVTICVQRLLPPRRVINTEKLFWQLGKNGGRETWERD